jgi:hypothetical protein
MPTPRGLLAVVAARCPFGSSRTCVYAIGGYVATALNTNEIYNPATNTWSTGPAMPTARLSLGAAAAPCPASNVPAGCVYAIGGHNGTFLNTVEVYNTFTNTWFTEPPMPTKRYQLAAASARCLSGQTGGSCVYAIDGSYGVELTTNEALKP